jgi:hypothetical protein
MSCAEVLLKCLSADGDLDRLGGFAGTLRARGTVLHFAHLQDGDGSDEGSTLALAGGAAREDLDRGRLVVVGT